MDLEQLKSISSASYDINLQKSNALKKAQADLVIVYNNHIFLADPNTICLVKTLLEFRDNFFILDTNCNPVKIDNPKEFLELLIQKHQSSLNTYHQLYQKIKHKEI